MPTTQQRLKSAKRLLKTWTENVEFIKSRIAIQDTHEDWFGKGRLEKSGGQWAELTYNRVEVKVLESRIKKAKQFIKNNS